MGQKGKFRLKIIAMMKNLSVMCKDRKDDQRGRVSCGSERSPWKLVGWVLFSVGSNQRL